MEHFHADAAKQITIKTTSYLALADIPCSSTLMNVFQVIIQELNLLPMKMAEYNINNLLSAESSRYPCVSELVCLVLVRLERWIFRNIPSQSVADVDHRIALNDVVFVSDATTIGTDVSAQIGLHACSQKGNRGARPPSIACATTRNLLQ